MRKLFSVDDHIVEPRDTWTSRVPARFKDRAPRVLEDENGAEYWMYEDTRHTYLGLNAVAGKPQEEWGREPMRFEDMIPGCYDAAARKKDFERAGIMSSLSFPTLPRFGGALFINFQDKELADYCVKAWNDFMYDWHLVAPEMYVPMAIIQLWDIEAAVKEIKRNLERGFRAITIPEETSNLGLPSYYSDYWNPIWEICESEGIPVCMHIASSGWKAYRPPESSAALEIALSMTQTITHAVGMMYGPVARKYPKIKLVYSEGGIGWVPVTLERADRQYGLHKYWGDLDQSLTPSQICKRNMWFCMIDEPYGLANRHEIGLDKIFWECDYPHANCIWDETQPKVEELFADIPDDEAEMILYKNAEKMFDWKVPEIPEWAREAHIPTLVSK
ncbi:amidohydrolase family protein [Rhodococcus gordoniae]|uniref:amidohydrolase family protein n=1 Tax=Rhodococcus gordoniae TaxID=223392 RepID=UPI0020CD7D0D|nr:amidohydrolase family protein [Rhodococcus gordoniae]UTT51035.1 amidohydrolase [Rhodococcus gordoniae]